MFKRLLIANRGEIAVRIARTCRALGIETVAVYSDADRRALHVLQSDRAVYIGPAPASESYLNIDAIVRAAVDSAAEALHPGYGLLSENAALADACAAAGLVFVGPSAAAMRAMGDKAAARKLAASHGVPIVPGYEGDHQDAAKLLAEAGAIGFPVMIKAAAGGGGRGMRLVESPDRFEEAAQSARREAERAFGDGRLILERAILGSRHIEMQIVADSRGNIVQLGERDCSIQRRHQKVVEETPSPAVDASLRSLMGEDAVKVARAVDYTNAGTVEFLLDAQGNFYFLEMNTRLQVEHGITELVTGLDLVALQLRIAAGEALPFGQGDVSFSGHAIECRVYAEDPASGYLPSAGRITVFEPPSGEGVRNDVGTYPGDEISTYYDPLLAKLLTWGQDRAQALQRMQEALVAYRVEGVKTNLSLLRTVLAHPAFQAGQAATDFLQQDLSPEALAAGVAEDALLAAFGAIMLGLGVRRDPWRAAGPWRPGGTTLVELQNEGTVYLLDGRREPGSAHDWLVRALGGEYSVRFVAAGKDTIIVERDGQGLPSQIVRLSNGIDVNTQGQAYRFRFAHREERHVPPEGHREQGLTAPMPGLVLRVLVREGERVRTHQTLVVLEAMKMEHAIEAPHDGIVKKLHCAEGGRVAEGALLIELEQEATP